MQKGWYMSRVWPGMEQGSSSVGGEDGRDECGRCEQVALFVGREKVPKRFALWEVKMKARTPSANLPGA